MSDDKNSKKGGHVEASDEGQGGKGGLNFSGFDLGALIGQVFGSSPFEGWKDIFKDSKPGADFTIDDLENNLDMNWDETIQAGATGAVSKILIQLKTSGGVKAFSKLKGRFQSLFAPTEEKKPEK